MKRLHYKIMLFLFVWSAPGLLWAQVTREKKIERSYQVPAQGSLEVDNKYGEVHIDTWTKPQLDVAVTIEVTKRSAAKAAEYLQKVKIDIEDSNPARLSFTTVIDGNINMRGNEKLRINYKIMMPVGHDLVVENRYGNVYLARASGKVDLSVKYGNLKTTELVGTAEVYLAYGNGEIEEINTGEVECRYSNLTVEEGGSLEVNTAYTNIDFGRMEKVDLTNKYGTITFEEVSSLRGESKYGSIKIDKLHRDLRLDMAYGGGVRVKWIANSFSVIELDMAYTSATLRFEQGLAAELEAELRYGNIDYDELEFDYKLIDKTANHAIYKGILGKGASRSKIIIEGAYSGAKLDYAE